MKAIETVYKGYKFRSRLEARWAVFFDTLDIPYEYEKEGYELRDMHSSELDDFLVDRTIRGGWYLPDFWLPEQDCWVEIKGEYPTQREQDKAWLLAHQANKGVHIFHGLIGVPNIGECQYHFYSHYGSDYQHVWCECKTCGKLEIHYCGLADRVSCHCQKDRGKYSNYNWLFGIYRVLPLSNKDSSHAQRVWIWALQAIPNPHSAVCYHLPSSFVSFEDVAQCRKAILL